MGRRIISFNFSYLLAILLFHIYFFPAEIILEAMRKELSRSIKNLKMEYQEKPYFISYRVEDIKMLRSSAMHGALTDSDISVSREVYVQVRVGSYESDNSIPGEDITLYDSTTIDDNIDSLRHTLWKLTDKAYKQALKMYLMKKGKEAFEVKVSLPDFTKVEPEKYFEEELHLESNIEIWNEKVKKFSSMFKKYPEILHSSVLFIEYVNNKYIVNSEGTEIQTSRKHCFLNISATVKAPDGMVLSNYRFYDAFSEKDLPDEKIIMDDIRNLINELLQLRNAEECTPYTAPAIFTNSASCLFFKNTLAVNLLACREKHEKKQLFFEEKINKKILPEYVDVVCDPTINLYKGKPLHGYYRYDDEGVKSQMVNLIENGVLKNFMTSRTPIRNFLKSNGHARGWEPRPTVSNFFVKPQKKFSIKELENMLIRECKKQRKSHGLIFISMSQESIPIIVYKLDIKSGKKELLRGVRISDFDLNLLDKIIAFGDDEFVYSGDMTSVPFSYICPSVLVKEVEIRPVTEKPQRPPILPHPLFDRQNTLYYLIYFFYIVNKFFKKF